MVVCCVVLLVGCRGERLVRCVLFLFGLFLSHVTLADIYHCLDQQGRAIFSDQACTDASSLQGKVEPVVNVAPFKSDEKAASGQQGDAKRWLYRGSRVGGKTRFVSVSIYEETDDYMIFEVEGYYAGPPNGRAEFRVMPNIHWQARSFSLSERGLGKGYARVQLGSKAEGGDVSDVITLQLWQYVASKTQGVLETKVIPYKKIWAERP